MTENQNTDTSILDDVIASVTNRLLVVEDEAKLIAKLLKKVLHGGASVEDLTRHRSFDAAKLEALVQDARTELQRRDAELGQAASSRHQNREPRDDTVVEDTENQPATHAHVSPSPRMKKLLAAKRRIQVLTATTEPDSDARVCESGVTPDLPEWLEPQPTQPALHKLEQKDRGQPLEEDAGRRTDDSGESDSLMVASGTSANDLSSGISGVVDHRDDKAMDNEMLEEYGFPEIYIHVEGDLRALIDDSNDLTNDEVQKDDIIEEDPSENQQREVDPDESSNDTFEGHSGTGFQISATAPPAMPLKYTKDDLAGTFTCDDCQYVLHSIEDLGDHYIALHAPTDPAYRCEMCWAYCKNQESLARHMRRKHATAVRQMKKINVPRYEAFAAELPAFQGSTASGN